MGTGIGHGGRWSALAAAVVAAALVLGPAAPAVPLPLPVPVVLVSVVVTPPVAAVMEGTAQQFTATGTYSDLTTRDITASVNWSSSDPSVASVSNSAGTKGRAAGHLAGSVTITATDPALGVFGAAVLAVTDIPVPDPVPAVLVGVVVAPAVNAMAVNTAQSYSATGTFSDLTMRDLTEGVTWSSSDPAVATVSNAAGSRGRVTAVAQGVATITATHASGTSGTGALTVTPSVPVPPIIPPILPPPTPNPPAATGRLFRVTPSSGGPWTDVRVEGVRFPARRTVKVLYATLAKPRNKKLCKTLTTSTGGFVCITRIPIAELAGPAGKHNVVAKVLRRPKAASSTATFTLQR